MLKFAPVNSCIKEIARSIAFSVNVGSTPLSNLKLASVCKACVLAVFLMEVALKIADSRKILVVLFEIPECKPPKTPAIQRFLPPLVIISSLPISFRFSPSKVSNSVPFFAFLIDISSFIALRSKACIGVPNSNITKLVTSTILLTGSNPIDFR